MLQASEVLGLAIEAKDGRIGSVGDLLFDDRSWTIRWAVIDTGDWLPGRSVLLPPSRLAVADLDRSVLRVDLTRAEVRQSPGLSRDMPVSRRYEEMVYDYYGWSPYWVPGLAGFAPFEPPLYAAGAKPVPPEPQGDPDLHSIADVTGYSVEARDGAIGHVHDFLIKDHAGAVRYLVVDTRNWWPGKKVLVAPHWIEDISWSERAIHFDVTRERIRSAPEYDPKTLGRDYEERLHAHYDLPTYWL
jgi:uncharacterized protein YrrD